MDDVTENGEFQAWSQVWGGGDGQDWAFLACLFVHSGFST